MSTLLYALLLASGFSSASAVSATARASMQVGVKMDLKLHENPMREIIDLLKDMLAANMKDMEEADKIEEERACDCQRRTRKQQEVVDHYAGDLKILEPEYIHLTAEVHGLNQKLNQTKDDLEAAKKALEELKGVDESQYEEGFQRLEDYKTNLKAIDRAISAMEKGAAGEYSAKMENMTMNASAEGAEGAEGAFLQTSAAADLRKVLNSTSSAITDADRDTLTAFLDQGSGDQEDTEVPEIPEVVGILKQIRETMKAEMHDFEANYKKGVLLMKNTRLAKEKEIADLTALKEVTLAKLAEYTLRLSEVKAQLIDILEGGYLREKDLLDDIKAMCDAAKKRYEAERKVRLEEAHALQETINLLDEDDTLHLFKKTLHHRESFLQVDANRMKMASEALNARRKGKRDYRVEAIALIMQGKAVDMTKVVTMIDQLVGILRQEEADEAEKKVWCDKELGQAFLHRAFLAKKMAPIKALIADEKARLKQVKEEIDFTVDALQEIEKSIKKKEDERRKQKSRYIIRLHADQATMNILKTAKLRLVTFYKDPDLEKGISLVQLDKIHQDAAKVLDLLDKVIDEHDLHMKEEQVGERLADEDFQAFKAACRKSQEFMVDHLFKLRTEKTDLDIKIGDHMDEYRDLYEEEAKHEHFIMTLHKECDWLIENIKEREKARQGEIASLRSAKAVLQGADYGFTLYDEVPDKVVDK